MIMDTDLDPFAEVRASLTEAAVAATQPIIDAYAPRIVRANERRDMREVYRLRDLMDKDCQRATKSILDALIRLGPPPVVIENDK